MEEVQLHEQRNKCNTLFGSTNEDYIKNKIENVESPKDMVCEKLLNREQKAILQSRDGAQSPANASVEGFNERLNSFETTLKHHWIHQRIKFQRLFSHLVVSPTNNLMLFLKLISGRLLAHHQRTRMPLTQYLHGYSNNANRNWHMVIHCCKCLIILCRISYWA